MKLRSCCHGGESYSRNKCQDVKAKSQKRFFVIFLVKKQIAQLKAINSTESARESNSRSKDTKPRKRGCLQPDD
jgi:hypothetical protein